MRHIVVTALLKPEKNVIVEILMNAWNLVVTGLIIRLKVNDAS